MQGAGGLKITFFERSAKGVWILDRDERLKTFRELLRRIGAFPMREPHLYRSFRVGFADGPMAFLSSFRTIRILLCGTTVGVARRLGHDGADLRPLYRPS